MGQVLPHPFATIANGLPDNVQGSFQVCRITNLGLMTFTCEGGQATVALPAEIGALLLQCMPDFPDDTPPKQYA